MQRVISKGLWSEIAKIAQRAHRRSAAIAYITKDLIGFRTGDVLVVDASERAIKCGETSAPSLKKLKDIGVRIYSCLGLHAKVLVLGDVAVIGSGNMSSFSANGLIEAAIITDHASTVAGVQSFVEQLVQDRSEVTLMEIARLCAIEVVRTGGRGGGCNEKDEEPRHGNDGARREPMGGVAHSAQFIEWLETHDKRKKKANTAREYEYFLRRCAEHYDEALNEKSVSSLNDANEIISRVRKSVAATGRTGPGTFNMRDVTQNLGPALRAYARFAVEQNTNGA